MTRYRYAGMCKGACAVWDRELGKVESSHANMHEALQHAEALNVREAFREFWRSDKGPTPD